MVEIKTTSVTIGGHPINRDKSGYPSIPTVFSGVDIQWGAPSCIEHPEPSRAQLSLWIPKSFKDRVPAIGDVVSIRGGHVHNGTTQDLSLFAGKVESVKLKDDHKAYTETAPLLPNSTNITAKTGWVFSSVAGGSSTGTPKTDITSKVTIDNGDSFVIPRQTTGSTYNWLFAQTPKASVVAGETYFVVYETNNTNYTTTDVKFWNASGTQVGTTTTKYNLRGIVDFTAPTGAASVTVEVYSIVDSNVISTYGEFKIGRFVMVQKQHGDTPGYRVNIVAADALAEASRLRLSDTPWPFESVLNRQGRIATLATNSGVKFNSGLTAEQGYSEGLGTYVVPRDVDSAPALETFQRTAMAAGHTVVSVDNVVQPSFSLKLPNNLTPVKTTSNTQASWSGTPGASESKIFVNGVATRTNHANNPAGALSSDNYSVTPGAGGAAVLNRTSDAYIKGAAVYSRWDTDPSVSGVPSLNYKDAAISGVSGAKVSVGVIVKSDEWQKGYKDFKISVTLWNGTTSVASYTSASKRVMSKQWSYITYDNLAVTGAYNAIEIKVLPQSFSPGNLPAITAGEAVYFGGIIIEKTAAVGKYFDGNWIAPDASAFSVERNDLCVLDIWEVEDDTFEIDTTKVVNEISVEMKRVVGTGGTTTTNEDANQVFTDEAGSRKTTPQTRSLATDWAIRDAYMQNDLPTSVMVAKAKLLLAGQSRPQWRLSEAIRPVLKVTNDNITLTDVLDEDSRFGSLISIWNGPDLLPDHFRVHAGRIVLGDHPMLEFEVEPVDYSAPIPLTYNTLRGDSVAAYTLIGNMQTLTSNDLRFIGAR